MQRGRVLRLAPRAQERSALIDDLIEGIGDQRLDTHGDLAVAPHVLVQERAHDGTGAERGDLDSPQQRLEGDLNLIGQWGCRRFARAVLAFAVGFWALREFWRATATPPMN